MNDTLQLAENFVRVARWRERATLLSGRQKIEKARGPKPSRGGALLWQIWRGSPGCVPNGTPSYPPQYSNPGIAGKLQTELVGAW